MGRKKDSATGALSSFLNFAGRALLAATGTYAALWLVDSAFRGCCDPPPEAWEMKRRSVASRGTPLSEVTVKSGDSLSALVWEHMGGAAQSDLQDVVSLNKTFPLAKGNQAFVIQSADLFSERVEKEGEYCSMDASAEGDRVDLNPLSSLDLVDAFLDVDDTVNTYLKNLQPPADNPEFMLTDVNAVHTWSGMLRGYPSGSGQPQPQPQEVAYPFNTSQPQAGVQHPPGDAQVVTTGGDPGFVFQADAGKSSAESGSTTAGRGRKRASSNSSDGAVQKKHQVTQEKNRLAQRRFRERQKAKVQGLHTEIDDLRAQVGALQMQNSALHSQNSILEKVLSMRDEQINAMQEENSILGMGSADEQADRGGHIVLSGLKGEEVKLSRADLKQMTPDQIKQIFQAYVNEVSEALVEVGTGGSGAMDRIELLVNEICMLCLTLNAVNPVSAGKMNIRDFKETEAEELKQWKAIVATLELTDEQKREIIQLRKMLLQKLQHLLAEKGKLNLTIQPALPSSIVGHRIAVEYLKANQTLVRLKDILKAENRAMLDFVTAFSKEVMKPLQIAKVLVQSYPVKPDLLAIASSIAMECGEDLGVPEGGAFPILDADPISAHCDGAPPCFMGQATTCGSELAGQNVLTRLGLNPEH